MKALSFTLITSLTLTVSSHAATVLADDFTGVTKSGTTATIGSWDTVDGISAPSTSLTFFDANDTPTAGDDGVAALGFHDVTTDQIDVNQNMSAGGWRTSISLDLDGSTVGIDLTTLILDMRLANGTGGDNTTNNKSGRMTVELVGSLSGLLGTVDPGNSNYPSVNYTRILDLTTLPTLSTAESYTLNISAIGTGFGHHKSLRSLSLEGDITVIPEPSAAILGLAGISLMLRRRRK